MSKTLLSHNGETGEAVFYSPADGAELLRMNTLDIELVHAIANAIRKASDTAWNLGRLRMQNTVELYMDTLHTPPLY